MKYPWFHKIPIPFSLLLVPATYLYIRSVLQGELKFKKYDWMLAIPAILFAINLLPYYLMPNTEKTAYLVEYYKKSSLRSSDGEGYLPAFVFSFLRVAWSLLFIILNYQLIRGFKIKADKKLLSDNEAVLNWLTILNLMLTCFVAAALFAAIIAPIIKTTYTILNFSLGVFSIIICLTLFFRPKILYGVYQPLSKIPNELKQDSIIEPVENEMLVEEHKLEKNGISQTEAVRYKKMIENHFRESKPFLRSDYSLEELVNDIKIPRYILSAFVNKEYGMGFREFLNRYRIQYMIENLNKPEWENFTIDAISSECGFKSRITFFNNFKQITGQTPSQYIKSKNESRESI